MPSGPRIRANNVFGVTSDNPLSSVATTFNSASLFLLPVVSSAHAIIVLDPKRVNGEPEIVVVTAHTALATSATITRGAYGTTARAHPMGTAWANVVVTDDMVPIVTSSTRPSDPYRGQMIFENDTDKFVGRSQVDAWVDLVPMGAWQSWTPAVVQSGAVTTTNTRSVFTRYGRMVVANFRLSVTGSGTGGNSVTVSLPFTAATATGNTIVGSGAIFDASTNTHYVGMWLILSTTTIILQGDWSGPNQWGILPNTALASTDLISGVITYEAAS